MYYLHTVSDGYDFGDPIEGGHIMPPHALVSSDIGLIPLGSVSGGSFASFDEAEWAAHVVVRCTIVERVVVVDTARRPRADVRKAKAVSMYSGGSYFSGYTGETIARIGYVSPSGA